MPLIWEAFVRDYEKQIPFRSVADILCAFWHYSNAHGKEHYMDRCNEIMGKLK